MATKLGGSGAKLGGAVSPRLGPKTAAEWLYYLDSDVSVHSHVSRTVLHCFGILRQLHNICVSLGFPVSRCCIGADEARLQKCHTGW